MEGLSEELMDNKERSETSHIEPHNETLMQWMSTEYLPENK